MGLVPQRQVAGTQRNCKVRVSRLAESRTESPPGGRPSSTLPREAAAAATFRLIDIAESDERARCSAGSNGSCHTVTSEHEPITGVPQELSVRSWLPDALPRRGPRHQGSPGRAEITPAGSGLRLHDSAQGAQVRDDDGHREDGLPRRQSYQRYLLPE